LLATASAIGLAPETYRCDTGTRLHGLHLPSLVTNSGGLLVSLPSWHVNTKLVLHNPF
jgi:hypothetical protein